MYSIIEKRLFHGCHVAGMALFRRFLLYKYYAEKSLFPKENFLIPISEEKA
jgi:hypothetical protein